MSTNTKNFRAWAIVAVSFLILMFIFATCISCMGVYVKPVSEELGIPRTSFTLITSIQAFALMLSSMLAGKLLQTCNMKLLMVLGTAASALCMFIYSAAPSIIYFYLAGILMGVAVAFTCNIPISMLIKNWFDEKREGFALGIAFVGSGAGAMVLNPLYTFLIDNYGWRTSFLVSGIFMVVILIPLILIFVTREPADLSLSEDAGTAEKLKEIGKETENDLTLSQAVHRPQTWAVFIAYIILIFISMAILNHGIPFMTDYGMSPSKAATIISVSSGVLIAGKVAAGALYDRFGIRRVTVIETVLVTACFTCFWANGLLNSPILIGLFFVLYGIGVPVATLSMPLVLPVMYGKSNFGSIMGMFSMSSGIGGMLQVVVSLIYDSAGSYYPAWIMMSILCVLAVGIFVICIKPLKR